ncbi:hypothetical protein D9757_004098 [Collybiopsis confluens]|uniref:XPG-I domain-containing protein n=1 Tax=Collybiopsis confluens TaxID=2823264 RepID=A0A8H5MDH2_9AGAR|nr:hypothetical protein D9757_004098 [Collybiopsis confluens]
MEIIKRLPHRLQGFAGKRIVLTHYRDGTLLTQRFHFAQIPHPSRHVLGWYKLIKELKDFGVEAICVFDGKERNLAKAQEASRRKNVRLLTTARASIENQRLVRLNRLSKIISSVSELEHLARFELESEAKQFDPLTKNGEDLVSQLLPLESDIMFMDEWYSEFKSRISLSEAEEALRTESSAITTEFIPDVPAACHNSLHVNGFDLDGTFTELDASPVEFPASPSDFSLVPKLKSDDLLFQLRALYKDYRNSIPKVVSFPLSNVDAAPTAAPTLESPAVLEALTEDGEDSRQEARDVYEMSKRQIQLSLQEKRIWNSFASTLDAPDIENIHREIRELLLSSNIISESYRVRLNPPTSRIYAECKEILRAMGVSCVDCSGPFEAEALASAFVLNGYADYVASEDTDVLIYEAPLIRNITSRQLPLMVISGAELRSNLKLTRPMFIDFALLLGTDFSQRVQNVGPTRALGFIRTHGSIEKFIDTETKFKLKVSREEYMRQVNSGRNVFQTLPPVPKDIIRLIENTGGERSMGDMDQVAFVMGKYGLSREIEPSADWDSEEGALEGNYFDDDSGWAEKDHEGGW